MNFLDEFATMSVKKLSQVQEFLLRKSYIQKGVNVYKLIEDKVVFIEYDPNEYMCSVSIDEVLTLKLYPSLDKFTYLLFLCELEEANHILTLHISNGKAHLLDSSDLKYFNRIYNSRIDKKIEYMFSKLLDYVPIKKWNPNKIILNRIFESSNGHCLILTFIISHLLYLNWKIEEVYDFLNLPDKDLLSIIKIYYELFWFEGDIPVVAICI